MFTDKAYRGPYTLLFLTLVFAGCAHREPAAVTPPPIRAAAAPVEAAAARVPRPGGARPVLHGPVNTGPKLPPAGANGTCHADGKLEDAACTPGVASDLVTQANIKQTICVPVYSTKIRKQYAPSSYTSALKKQQIKEYGYRNTDPSQYEEDHLISLELGGHPNDPRNLWPELGPSPNPKDSIERLLHKRICDGEITLEEAQRAISTDWTTAQ
jgi:hypothetical protein